MIDKRNTTMIDKDRVVLYCISCHKRYIEDKNKDSKCPNCQQNTLVVERNLLVLK